MSKDLTSVEDAISIILKRINILPSNEIPLINGIGKTLSEPVLSKLNNPPTNVSSMDGYAIKNSDLEKGIYKKGKLIKPRIGYEKKIIKTTGEINMAINLVNCCSATKDNIKGERNSMTDTKNNNKYLLKIIPRFFDK